MALFSYSNFKPIEDLLELMGEIKDLRSASSLLDWDQETYMPRGATGNHSEINATIDKQIHSILTGDKADKIHDQFLNTRYEVTIFERRLFGLFMEERRRALKVPVSLVAELARQKTTAVESWRIARLKNDFSLFRNDLNKIIALKINEAECLGAKENTYDALLDIYEPGMTESELTAIFNSLKEKIIPMLGKVRTSGLRVDTSFLFELYPREGQIKFIRLLADMLSFDFKRGRIDSSSHPFTTALSANDVRLTYRTNENDIRMSVYCALHELGHGLYEQGIAPDLYRTFAGEAVSYGIHESQAMFWEKIIGKSPEFAQWCFIQLKSYFPGRLKGISPVEFYFALNKVEPTLIRTEADELTYMMHILLRFEMEDDLINKRYTADSIPSVWNEKMEKYLGIVPANDSEGCLQDIHWALGAFGYFPSYALGALYSAMLATEIKKQMPDWNRNITEGYFTPIIQWLKENIHTYGKTENPNQISLRLFNKKITTDDFLKYIKAKLNAIYSVS
ncbi:MAG: Thermostable carboxypeptidase 1 [Ignavibacteria bacterium]|nr:Thermostable carboxypeptidase 1 [Ignavibacteria bacterium]